MPDNIIPLEAAPTGSRVKVVSVNAPGRWSQRLIQMGFVPGAIVEVVFNRGAGPVVVRILGATISLGRGIARRILVTPV